MARPVIGPLLLEAPRPDRFYRRILADTVGQPAVQAMPQELVRATYLGIRRPGFGSTVSSSLREMFRGADAELAKVSGPVALLLGRGEADPQDSAVTAERAALMPKGRFDLVPGGHEPWFDDVDACAAHISQFLAAV